MGTNNVARLAAVQKNTSSLWLGPRQSGKSTLIKAALQKENFFEVNLLETDTFKKYLTHPEQLRKDIEYQVAKHKTKFVFIDEIQKIPALTNEVHLLIEKYKSHPVFFILSGSSARKLKRGNANLLAGRALLKKLFPLHCLELKEEFQLETCIQYGSLAGIYFEPRDLKIQKLQSYVDTYLKEEIAQEGLVRNFALFNRFLDVAGMYGGEIISYSNITREAGISIKTVQNYFSILYETLIAYELPAWGKTVKRQLSKHPKFYFCDNGIHNAILKNLKDPLHPSQRGKLFEQWLINETRALLSYSNSELEIYFWRTERGEFEVDLILAKGNKPAIALEIKAKSKIDKKDFSGLLQFQAEFPKTQLYCAYEGTSAYMEQGIEVLPYQKMLEKLRDQKP